jgi:hypothetical protein
MLAWERAEGARPLRQASCSTGCRRRSQTEGATDPRSCRCLAAGRPQATGPRWPAGGRRTPAAAPGCASPLDLGQGLLQPPVKIVDQRSRRRPDSTRQPPTGQQPEPPARPAGSGQRDPGPVIDPGALGAIAGAAAPPGPRGQAGDQLACWDLGRALEGGGPQRLGRLDRQHIGQTAFLQPGTQACRRCRRSLTRLGLPVGPSGEDVPSSVELRWRPR